MPLEIFVRVILLWSALLCPPSISISSELDNALPMQGAQYTQEWWNSSNGEWSVLEADYSVSANSVATQPHALNSNEDSACTLKEETISKLYNNTHKTWLLDDLALEDINYDIQGVIECASVNDTIQLSSNQTIRPSGTLSISFPIRIESFFQANNTNREDHRAVLTCPKSKSLLEITASEFTVSNLRISNCTQSEDDVITLNVFDCSGSAQDSRILFEGVEFSHLKMSGKQRILEVINAECGNVEFKDVEIRDNACCNGGCFVLPIQSHITSSSITRNRNSDKSQENTVFKIRSRGQLQVENIIATNNSIRVFYIDSDAGLDVRDSFFGSNMEKSTLWESKAAGRGAVLYAYHAEMVSISNTTFIDNIAGSAGGAIFSVVSSISIKNCAFVNNTVFDYFGGVVYFVGDASLNVSTSIFERNNAGGSGAALYLRQSSQAGITHCRFANNTTPGQGGDIFMHDNITLSLTNSTLTAERGGSISIETDSNATITRCQFEGHSAFYEAGAICVADKSSLVVQHSSFSRNKARRHGGVLRVNRKSYVSIFDCKFLHNHVEEFDSTGGAISVPYLGTLVIEGSYFLSNSAQYGGSIYLREETKANLTECAFEDNSASSNGGVIAMISNATLEISKSRFTKNRGIDGGVLYTLLRSSAIIRDSFFEHNNATSAGGGLHLRRTANVSLFNTTFIGNSGDSGGALSLTESSIGSISNCTFKGNEGISTGGAIRTSRNRSSLTVTHSFFKENKAKTGGALAADSDNELTIMDCFLTNNTATEADNRGSIGAALHGAYSSFATIEQCLFNDNLAKLKGGALRIEWNSILFLNSSYLTRNLAVHAGGVISSNSSKISVQLTIMKFNEAEYGGSIHGNCSEIHISNSSFQRNRAGTFGGFLSVSGSTVKLKNLEISSNEANETGGGIFAEKESILHGSYLTISSNIVTRAGGGVALVGDSALRCFACEIMNNTADSGGGVYIISHNKQSIVAQLQDSILHHNNAISHGGGMSIKLFVDRTIQCHDKLTSCSSVILLNTSFVSNSATTCGAAILLTDPAAVLVSCDYTSSKEEGFLTPQDYRSLEAIQSKKLCKSWTGNYLQKDAYGRVIATYGREFSFALDSDKGVEIIGDVSSGFVLTNVRSGDRVSSVNVTIVDIEGHGPAPTFADPVETVVSSPDGLFQGNISLVVKKSKATITHIIGFKPPGNYTVLIIPQNPVLITANLTVSIRGCQVDEEPTSGNELCQECGQISYNFHPNVTGGCTPCPDGASCKGRYVVPQDGRWHKSPCHIEIKKCLNEDACQYRNRTIKLQNFTQGYIDCSFNESVLEDYGDLQCNQGYHGRLCGSCEKSYGLSSSFKCLQCPHILLSILTFIGSTCYLLATSSLTVQGALPSEQAENTQQEDSITPLLTTNGHSESIGLINGVDVKEEAKETSIQCHPVVQGPSLRQMSLPAPTVEEIDQVEVSKLKITETLKVLINFFQIIATAATINVNWTDSIVNLFQCTEYSGAEATSALSGPVDCLITSHSTAMRSIFRLLLGVMAPCIVIGIFAVVWALITFQGKKGMSYFWRRFTLSVVTVTYISYLGLTKLAIKVFYCVDIYDDDDPASHTPTSYLAMDTDIQCYTGHHILLMAMALVLLTLVTICFPVISAIVLARNQEHYQEPGSWIRETMGFLYTVFRERRSSTRTVSVDCPDSLSLY